LISENKMDIEKFLQKVEKENLKNIVQAISIPRHGWYDYEALSSVAKFIEGRFKEYGYKVDFDEFSYSGREYKNIIATLKDINSNKKWLLIGAHYDSAMGSPGADDTQAV